MRTVELIAAAQTWDLRHRVLRPHLAVYKPNPEDLLESTFHLGAREDDQVIGVASFNPAAHPELPARNPFRLRGMATDPAFRGQGIGREILAAGLRALEARGCDLLWCHAREAAFQFYEKTGFSYLGPIFEVPEIGPHKIMYRAVHS